MITSAPVDHIRVKFSGDRAGEGPLTWGQRNTYQWVSADEGFFGIVEWYVSLPGHATLEDVRESYAVLLARHESLRTTYDGTPPRQRVAGQGEVEFEVYAVDTLEESVDANEVGRRLTEPLRQRPFDLARDFPVRAAVGVRAGRPVAVALAFSHMAVDFIAMSVVARQLQEMVADPTTREVEPRGHQPLDQAAAEQTPRLRRRAERALTYWANQIRRTPQCLYPRSYDAASDEGPWTGWLRSPAAAMAMPHITARTGASRSMAALAALFSVLSHRAEQDSCVFVSLASNRFEPRLRDYVGTLAQDALVRLDTTGDSFDALVRRTGKVTFQTARYGLFDVQQLQETADAICYERGVSYQRDCAVNNLLVAPLDSTGIPDRSPADIPASLSDSTLNWWRPPPGGPLLRFDVVEVDGLLMLGLWTCDTGRVPRAEVELLLRATEHLLVAAAAGDVDLARLGEVTGTVPLQRGPDWRCVDSSWIELSQVQQLLEDALGVPARVFAADDGGDSDASEPASRGTEPVLRAYIAAGDQVRTPEEAHDACFAALPGRYTAVTPQHYVICDAAPDDPSDERQWRDRPVLAAGNGRRPALTRSGVES